MEQGQKTVIVFYSKDGSTRLGAGFLRQRTDAQIIELKEKKKSGVIRALFNKGIPLIGDPWTAMNKADEIYLMSPIWASHGVPALNELINKADFSGKKVHIITFQQSEELLKSDKVHQHYADLINRKNGTVKTKTALVGAKMNHCAEEDFVRKQIESLPLQNEDRKHPPGM